MLKVDAQKLLANDAVTIDQCIRFISRFLRKWISDPEIVADATQSAMVRLVAKLKETGELSPEDMLRELGNAANNALRRQLTRLRRKVVAYESEKHTQDRQSKSFEGYVDNCNELGRIESVLNHFDGRHVEMFIAKVLGFSTKEIAENHDTTTGAVRGVTDRTRQKLKLELTVDERRNTLLGLAKRVKHDSQSPFESDTDSSSQ